MGYQVEKKLDYTTLSTEKFVPLDDTFGAPQETRPLIGNYNMALKYPNGCIVQWNTVRKNLKTHVTLTGGTLDAIREVGFTDSEIMEWCVSMKSAKIGRVDLAVTSWHGNGSIHGFLPQMAHYYAANGMCETQLRLDKPVVNKNLEIETCYIGQRKKRQMLRVYDKGIELGQAANRIVRIEMERRYEVAHSISRDVVAGNDYGGVIKRYFDFPQVAAWNEIMDTPRLQRNRDDRVQKKQSDNDRLWQWIFNSVAPAYARALYNDGIEPSENPSVDRFARLITEHYNKLVDDGLQ